MGSSLDSCRETVMQPHPRSRAGCLSRPSTSLAAPTHSLSPIGHGPWQRSSRARLSWSTLEVDRLAGAVLGGEVRMGYGVGVVHDQGHEGNFARRVCVYDD